MKQKFSSSRILTILSSLKNIESDYPAGMLRKRRQHYLRQLQTAKRETAARQKSASR